MRLLRPPSRSNRANRGLATVLRQVAAELPPLEGAAIDVEVQPAITVSCGRLLSGSAFGAAVFAASFIRERRIVMDASLLRQPPLFGAILVHEIFHFVWAKFGNTHRTSFARLLLMEQTRRARGELGESAGVAKSRLDVSSARWRHYVCESFCDTASYLITGQLTGNDRRLAERWLKGRRLWFATREKAWKC